MSVSRTRAKPVKVAKCQVGHFAGELKAVLVGASESVRDAFNKANISIQANEAVLDLNGNAIDPSNKAKNGETYYLSQKYQSY